MECGGLPPLLHRARFAESKAAAPPCRHTPNPQPFHPVQVASAEFPPLKILLILPQNHPEPQPTVTTKEALNCIVKVRAHSTKPNPTKLHSLHSKNSLS